LKFLFLAGWCNGGAAGPGRESGGGCIIIAKATRMFFLIFSPPLDPGRLKKFERILFVERKERNRLPDCF